MLLEQRLADYLVDGIVPTDVFTDGHEPIVRSEQGGGMEPACPLEQRLRRTQSIG